MHLFCVPSACELWLRRVRFIANMRSAVICVKINYWSLLPHTLDQEDHCERRVLRGTAYTPAISEMFIILRHTFTNDNIMMIVVLSPVKYSIVCRRREIKLMTMHVLWRKSCDRSSHDTCRTLDSCKVTIGQKSKIQTGLKFSEEWLILML